MWNGKCPKARKRYIVASRLFCEFLNHGHGIAHRHLKRYSEQPWCGRARYKKSFLSPRCRLQPEFFGVPDPILFDFVNEARQSLWYWPLSGN